MANTGRIPLWLVGLVAGLVFVCAKVVKDTRQVRMAIILNFIGCFIISKQSLEDTEKSLFFKNFNGI